MVVNKQNSWKMKPLLDIAKICVKRGGKDDLLFIVTTKSNVTQQNSQSKGGIDPT